MKLVNAEIVGYQKTQKGGYILFMQYELSNSNTDGLGTATGYIKSQPIIGSNIKILPSFAGFSTVIED